MKTIIIDGIEYNLTPKVLFKKGDFVVIQETTYLISKIEGLTVTLSCNGRDCLFDINVLKNARLWDITKDAKDGDVLSFDNEDSNYHSIGIFKRIASKNEPNGNTYRCYVRYGGFKEKLEIPINGDESHHCGTFAHPATKEQRDLLFQKMKEAGYEWDAEKKELKKIEQKPAWTKEDGEMVETLNEYVKNLDIFFSEIKIGDKDILSKEFREKVQHWLKSLKERYTWKPNLLSDIISGCNKGEFSQFEYSLIHFAMACFDGDMTPKGIHCYAQTSLKEAKKEIKLTEEDEKTVHLACEFIRHHSKSIIDSIGGIDCSTLIERLKSLRPQSQWKPRESDILLLERIANGKSNPQDCQASLSGLIGQLKKLREE